MVKTQIQWVCVRVCVFVTETDKQWMLGTQAILQKNSYFHNYCQNTERCVIRASHLFALKLIRGDALLASIL